MPVPRSTSDTAKKLAEDIAKAERAIAALNTCQERLNRGSEQWRARFSMTGPEWDAAIFSEVLRLRMAIKNPRILWAIYRRADKGQPYFEAPVESQELAA